MQIERPLTIVESILLAAFDLHRTRGVFSAEDLVVKAWEKFPDRFGLQGYSDKYPDSNRILTKIMGAASPLKTKGWIERVGKKQYRLSEVGRLAADSLSELNTHHRLAGLPRRLVPVLRRMLDSTAYAKWRSAESPTFSDAAAFWNISARSTANQLNLRLSETDLALRLAKTATQSGTTLIPGTAQYIGQEQIAELERLSNEMLARFDRELAVIRRRTNERYA